MRCRRLFDFKLLDSKKVIGAKGAKAAGYDNLLSWLISAALDQEHIDKEFEKAAVMVAWKEWCDITRIDQKCNPSKLAIEKWLKKLRKMRS